jgi:hypothetical protein
MSVAPPPDPIVPIFNPLYWDFTSTDGATGITPAYLNLNYLKFPYAQGLENLQNTNVVGTMTVSGTTTLNDPLQVNDLCNITGALTVTGITTLNDPLQVNDTATVTGTLTASSTVTLGSVSSSVPTCLASYAAVLPTDSSTNIPTTAWVQTAISAGVAPTTPTLLIYDSVTSPGTFTPAFPSGTKYVDMALMGGGGASGTGGVVWNGGQSGSALGGAGGGGGCVYIQRLPVQGTATLAANITVGSYVTVYYTGSYGGTTVATAYWGSAGGNGDFSGPNSCVGGAGGAGGGTIVNFVGQGQTGTAGTGNQQQNSVVQTLSPPPWNLVNKNTAGGFSYLAKGFGNSVQGLTYGASSTLNGMNGTINYAPAGVGGIYFWCYKS